MFSLKRLTLPAARALAVKIAAVAIAVSTLTGCYEDYVENGSLTAVGGNNVAVLDQTAPQLQHTSGGEEIRTELAPADPVDTPPAAEIEAPAPAPVETTSSPPQDTPLDSGANEFCTVTRGPFSEAQIKAGGNSGSASSAKRPAAGGSFDQWLAAFKSQALSRGISKGTLKAAFAGITLNPKILELDRRQQEYSLTFFQYLKSGISQRRIQRGRALGKKHAALLAKVRKRYGIPPELLVALWGMETDFGANTGGFSVIRSLATLAYDGRRSEMYHGELLCALRIIEDGHISAKKMIGSWAGAMGQPQFMPSTFMRFAQDGNGDGKYDIWGNLPDVFESAANYLAASGWESGRTWGREVKLPKSLDPYQARLAVTKSIEEWRELGLVNADGSPLPQADIKGSVILPAGIKGPAFLVYNNFRVITEWNRSLYYALTVAHLSDRLSGRGPLVGKAPAGDRRLSRRDVIALQDDLNQLGFEAGRPDGMVGMKTREAVRKYQRTRNIPADGYPTAKLIARLSAEARGAVGQEPQVSKAKLLALQENLDRLGYDVGVPDGVMGPKTRSAVQSYQKGNSTPVDGLPTAEIMQRIADDARTRVKQ